MPKLLVVDDDLDVAEVVSSILQDEGFSVDIAHDGKEGLEKLEPERPDLVLLDIEMPVLDGPGMAYQMFLQNVGKELIPIILLSGVANLREAAGRVGTPYFLVKPYPVEALLSLVRRALTERRAPVPATASQP